MTTHLSGWCSPSFGMSHTAREHAACRAWGCGCQMHGGHETRANPLVLSGSERSDAVDLGQNQDGPGGLLREQPTVVPGPRPTLDRSAEL